MSFLYEFLKNINAWDFTESPPSAYGAFHLIFTLVGFALCGILAFLLRNSSDKVCDRLLFGIGLFLALTEVYKQLFYYYTMDSTPHYHWWIFPFQLCSVPMYMCLIIPFIKVDKVKNALYNFLVSYNLLGAFVSFFEPSGLIHKHWTLTVHAFIWHMLIVFVGVYIGLSGRAKLRGRGFFYNFILYVVICVIGFIINLSLRGVSDGSINMLYVGPSNSPIIVFKTICEKFGWYVNTPIYMFALTVGGFIISFPFRFIKNIDMKS